MTPKCANPALAFFLLPWICLTAMWCPSLEDQSMTQSKHTQRWMHSFPFKPSLPAVHCTSVHSNAILPVARGNPWALRCLFFLLLHIWSICKSLGSSLATLITSVASALTQPPLSLIWFIRRNHWVPQFLPLWPILKLELEGPFKHIGWTAPFYCSRL